jgi:hypothetical protein
VNPCTCPTSELGALDHGGSWTDEDCPSHGVPPEPVVDDRPWGEGR